MELAVRNLCFPGDEPLERIRSKNFGTPVSHLTHSKASVVMFFFGFNESFSGESGVKRYEADLEKLVTETLAEDFDGDGQPCRIVLVSPIAFENAGNKNWPDGVAENKRLKVYADAMERVAKKTGVHYADVFTPTLKLFADNAETLTLNGAHLNGQGYRDYYQN